LTELSIFILLFLPQQKLENHIPNIPHKVKKLFLVQVISAGLAIVTLEVPFWHFRIISLNNANEMVLGQLKRNKVKVASCLAQLFKYYRAGLF